MQTLTEVATAQHRFWRAIGILVCISAVLTILSAIGAVRFGVGLAGQTIDNSESWATAPQVEIPNVVFPDHESAASP